MLSLFWFLIVGVVTPDEDTLIHRLVSQDSSIVEYVSEQCQEIDRLTAQNRYEKRISSIQRMRISRHDRFLLQMQCSIEYVKEYKLDDNSVMHAFPEEIILSQAAIETGYGRSYSARKRNNFFGITDGNGNLKSYQSMTECLMDYFKNFETHRAYTKLRRQLEKGETRLVVLVPTFARYYAEDPDYAQKVLSVARRL